MLGDFEAPAAQVVGDFDGEFAFGNGGHGRVRYGEFIPLAAIE